jgi:hypothetical protein
MIAFLDEPEPLLRLTDALKLIPPGRGGRRAHLATVIRWIRKGLRTPNGETVYLDGLRVGNGWCTTKKALQEFMTALNPERETRPVAPRTPAARRREHERAERVLARAGI